MINITQYIEAVENGDCFSTLLDMKFLRDENDELQYIAGGEAVVFLVSIDEKKFALKCYFNDKKGLDDKYNHLSLLSPQGSFLSEFKYLKKELCIYCGENLSYKKDVLLYPWVEGDTLLELVSIYAEEHRSEKLIELMYKFIEFSYNLLSQPYSHGDLKPQNIIVDNEGEMFLIDYDMSCAENSSELQLQGRTLWYQHPKIMEVQTISGSIDDYSIAIIIVSIFLISLEPSLFAYYNNGENLIIDPREAINKKGVLHDEIISLLLRYPNMCALYDIVEAPVPISRDIKLLLNNIHTSTDINISKIDILDKVGGLKRVICDGLYGFVDANCKLVIGCCYADAQAFCDNYGAVKLYGKWFFINKNGVAISDDYFDEVGEITLNIAPVSKNGRWFYYDISKKSMIFDIQFDRVFGFSSGVGLVCEKNKYFFILENGKRLFEKTEFDYARPFKGDHAIIGESFCGQIIYNIINQQGKKLINPTINRILSVDSSGEIKYRENGEIVVKNIYLC